MNRYVTALILVGSVGCGKGSTQEAPPTKTDVAKAPATVPADASVPDKPAEKPFTLPAAPPPGPAYIALHGGLAVILPDGTAKPVAGIKDWVKNLVVGADGNAYTSGTGNDYEQTIVFRLDGASATKLGTVKAYTVTALAAAKDGTVYAGANEVMHKLAGGKDEKLPAPGIDVIRDLAVDADGAVIAAGYGKLMRFANGTWTALLDKLEQFDDITLFQHGDSVVAVNKGKAAYVIKGGKAELAYGSVKDSTDRASLTPTGLLALREYVHDAWQTRLTAADGATTTSKRVPARHSNLEVDGQGRVWWIDSGGLSVASLTSDAITEYPIATLSALTKVGDRNMDHEILVIGGGPSTLPAAEPQRVVDQVTATVIVGKGPLAGAEALLCTSTNFSFQSNPCEDTKASFKGTTDDKGKVTFEKVPLGNYQLAFLVNGKWTLAGSTFIELYAPAPKKDLGKLRYE
jgi:hypothetical protein